MLIRHQEDEEEVVVVEENQIPIMQGETEREQSSQSGPESKAETGRSNGQKNPNRNRKKSERTKNTNLAKQSTLDDFSRNLRSQVPKTNVVASTASNGN